MNRGKPSYAKAWGVLIMVLTLQSAQGSALARLFERLSSPTSLTSPTSPASPLSPPSPYTRMQLYRKTVGSQEFVASREEPMSPDKGDEYDSKHDKDVKLLHAKNVLAAAVSSKGTFAAVIAGIPTRKLIVRDGHGNERGIQIVGFGAIMNASFWGEHVILFDDKGSTRYWDSLGGNKPHGLLSGFDVRHGSASAVAVDEKGRYAVVSAVSEAHGQKFRFFHTINTSKEEAKGTEIHSWCVQRRDPDKLKERVTAIATNPRGSTLAVATEGSKAKLKIQLWQLERFIGDDRQYVVYMLPKDRMKAESFKKITTMLHDDDYIAGASSQGNMAWWDTRTGTQSHYYAGCHQDVISSFKHLKGPLYGTGSADGMVKLWDIRYPTRPLVMMTHGCPVTAVTRLDSGGLASCSKNGVVKYWDFQGKPLLSPLPSP